MALKSRPDLSAFLQEAAYFFDSKVSNYYPGRWQAKARFGSGFSFEKFEKFSNCPDFRRMDFLASARNVLSREPIVRLYKQSARIDTVMLADLSRSMSFVSAEPKYWQVAKLATLFGYTAYRFGDRFGFVGCGAGIIDDLIFPPAKLKTYGLEIGEKLLDFRPVSCSSNGFLDALAYVKRGKTLVILVSDFYFGEDLLCQVLESLRGCQVLPIILRYRIEKSWRGGCFGLVRFRDLETKKMKTFFLFPRSIRRFNESSCVHEQRIKKIFQEIGNSPVVLSIGEVSALEIISQIQGEEE